MTKLRLAFDIEQQNSTEVSVDRNGAPTWDEQIELREGDELRRSAARTACPNVKNPVFPMQS